MSGSRCRTTRSLIPNSSPVYLKEEPDLSADNPSRSELRTLLTKAHEGLRIAKEILGSIELILTHQERGSLQYNVALFCHNAARKVRDTQQQAVDKLKQQRKVVGSYTKKKRLTPLVKEVPVQIS
jgi:hypothetical protein